MSWSITFEAPHGDWRAAADEAIAAMADDPQGDGTGNEVREQVGVAREALSTLVHSGFVGDASVRVRASLSGHANPGHVPQEGHANDTISVTVSQVKPEPALTA